MREVDLPDFEDMQKLIDLIDDLGMQKVVLENNISEQEAELFKKVTTETRYFVNGKAPSVSYINATYKVTGLDNELIPLRKQLAELELKLQVANHKLRMLRDMIDVWRSEQANKRMSLL